MASFFRTVADVFLIAVGGPVVLIGVLIKEKRDRRNEQRRSAQVESAATAVSVAQTTGVTGNNGNLLMTAAADEYTGTVEIKIMKTDDEETASVMQTVDVGVELQGNYYVCSVPLDEKGRLAPNFNINKNRRSYVDIGNAAKGIKGEMRRSANLTERSCFRQITRQEYDKLKKENKKRSR